jgi:hypothetical protein
MNDFRQTASRGGSIAKFPVDEYPERTPQISTSPTVNLCHTPEIYFPGRFRPATQAVPVATNWASPSACRQGTANSRLPRGNRGSASFHHHRKGGQGRAPCPAGSRFQEAMAWAFEAWFFSLIVGCGGEHC